MSDTRQLLQRISAFRARLEEVPRLEPMAESGPLLTEPRQLGTALHPIATEHVTLSSPAEPPKLTARAVRLLTSARQIVEQQRRLIDDSLFTAQAEHDPLAKFHRGTVGLTDSALRLAQMFPPEAEAQLQMCDGFEHLLQVIRHRLSVLEHAMKLRRTDTVRLERLVEILTAIHRGQPMRAGDLIDFAEVILDDARQGQRIRYLHADPMSDGVARAVACHAMNVSQVLARIVAHDFEWAGKPTIPIVGALLMDVGMLDLPPELLAKSESLTDEERRQIERHPLRTAELVRASMPETESLPELLLCHHERLDGSGYPNGTPADGIASLPRLIAVADYYATRMTARPHRPALEPRAALTETLLAAEQGKLDRDVAEYLMNLSFHPVGTVVELADGRLAVVAATHNSRTNLRASMRPVVAVLTNSLGEVLPRPEFLDLAATQIGSIVRALSSTERRDKLGEWYPDLCL